MSNIIIFIFTSFGAVFVLLAGIGIIRMPDLYLRISVTTKAATLGIGLILIGAGVYFNDYSITTRVLAIILFIFLTAPVGAHLIGRSSYFTGVKLWKKSLLDDLEGKYEIKTHTLQSGENKENTPKKDAQKEMGSDQN